MECVEVCDDDALRPVKQTDGVGADACATTGIFGATCRRTPKKYIRVDDLEEGIGALETILLGQVELPAVHQRRRRLSRLLGEDRPSSLRRHRRSADATADRKAPRVTVTELIGRLKKHIQLRLAEEINVSDRRRHGQGHRRHRRSGRHAGSDRRTYRNASWRSADRPGLASAHDRAAGEAQDLQVEVHSRARRVAAEPAWA